MADNDESQQIRLTGELVNEVLRVLAEHEPQCNTGLVSCQYLSAIQAMLICERVAQTKDRMEIVDELAAFMRYAVQDMAQTGAPAAQAPPPPSQDAVGVWKPDES